MTDGLIRAPADWIVIWRARIAELELTHREVDHLAGLGDGYVSKIMAGMKKPGAETIARMCRGLAIVLAPKVDADLEAIIRAEAVKRRRV